MNKAPSSKYKIRFHDCDMFGHLNNARYIDYMIDARQDHLKETYEFDYKNYYKNDQGWVVAYHEIQYLKPAFFDEIVCIQSSLLAADTETLGVEILMMNETKSQLKAILRSKLTFINLKTGRKEQHKPDFLEWAGSLLSDEETFLTPIQERIKSILTDLKKPAAENKGLL
jgi:YbgC/YbaW family acyl-CoA thioester hydrolase